MNYYLSRAPRGKHARKSEGRQSVIVCAICLGFCFTLGSITSCVKQAWAPKQNPKPRFVGSLGIRDREAQAPRYSLHRRWQEDTTTTSH